jgi:uncharacterized membrane-anchored protein YjiN (DUF445 family)
LNKADKTLCIVFVLFLLSLGLHLSYPQNLLADLLLFCSEAALVGGIADWFAVTALFEKPLGFPYHTAILPRRREAFIEASVTLVQQEFFCAKAAKTAHKSTKNRICLFLIMVLVVGSII